MHGVERDYMARNIEFLLPPPEPRCDADVGQHGAGEFGKEALDEIEPGAVLGSESKFEPVRALAGEPGSGLFGDVRGVMQVPAGRPSADSATEDPS
jgi:hypothetical protein